MDQPLQAAEDVPQLERDAFDAMLDRKGGFLEFRTMQMQRRIVRETYRFSGNTEHGPMNLAVVVLVMKHLGRIFARRYAGYRDHRGSRRRDRRSFVRAVILEEGVLRAEVDVNMRLRQYRGRAT